jgi:GNAT superfamily N-acetyltransferase
MSFDVSLVTAEEVRPLRELYRAEMNCQIIHDSWLQRGWTDPYLFRKEGEVIGYGLVGGIRAENKTVVIEFYVLPIHRGAALPLFRQFVTTSGALSIETQTNDILTTLMLYDCSTQIESNAILFRDGFTTNLKIPEGQLRQVTSADKELIEKEKLAVDATWMIEVDGTVAATGGLLFHYNLPYGDIYMAVAEPYRKCGYGSFLVQELKRICYTMGRIPAARCNAANQASRATLQKAGMLPCARMMTGSLKGTATPPT